ncbi:MAG: hypothetical protein RLZZ453_668 [Chlamydiota bacterium]|jgi:hypothetical protein
MNLQTVSSAIQSATSVAKTTAASAASWAGRQVSVISSQAPALAEWATNQLSQFAGFVAKLGNQAGSLASRAAVTTGTNAAWAGRQVAVLGSQALTQAVAMGQWTFTQLQQLATLIAKLAGQVFNAIQPYATSALNTASSFLAANARDIRIIGITMLATLAASYLLTKENKTAKA